MVHTGTGLCLATLANTRTQPHDEIDDAMNNLIREMARSISG